MTANPQHSFSTLPYAALLKAATASDTTLYLIHGGGSEFQEQWTPGHNLYLTITNPSADIEVVKVTAIYADELTVERGQDGTTAQAWAAGSVVSQRGVAADYNGFLQKGAFLTGSVNPNGVYSVSYPGQKYYQDGSTACEKRWFIGISGTTWKRIAGTLCIGSPVERSLSISPYYYNTALAAVADNGSGTILAVGNYSGYLKWCRVYRSTDHGQTWSMVTKLPAWDGNVWYKGIAYGGGVWVIVGGGSVASVDESYILTSNNDGDTWTRRTADSSYDKTFQKVRYLAGKFIAVGEDGEIQTSSDGTTWTRAYQDTFLRDIRDVAYDGTGKMYALQNGRYDNPARLLVSTNGGTTWAWQDTGDPSIMQYAGAIVYDSTHGRWVAFMSSGSWTGHYDNIYYSDDGGTNWTSIHDLTVSYNITGAHVHNGNYVIVDHSQGYGRILTSTTGISGWTDVTPATRVNQQSPYNDEYWDVLWDGTNWVVVGHAGYMLSGENRPCIRTSTDRLNWPDSPPSDEYASEIALNCVAYGGPDSVIIGGEAHNSLSNPENPDFDNFNGPIGYSAGTDFTAIVSTFITSSSGNIQGLVWTGATNDKWLAAYGVQGIYSTPVTDKVTWTRVSTYWADRLAINTSDYSKVVGCGTVGDHSAILYSSDYGSSWSILEIVPEGSGIPLWALAYGNGVFVVAGYQGFIATSSDNGLTWTIRTAAGSYTGTFYGACYDSSAGEFYLVGDSGEIQKSGDGGATWSEISSGVAVDLKGIAYGAGTLLSVGANGTMRLLESGGTSWQTVTPAGSYSGTFNGVAYYGGNFVVVGDNAEIQTVPVN